MLLYTIMPYDAIFGQGMEQPPKASKTGISVIRNGYLEWTQVGGKRRVSRIDSTNPADYLRADYVPGAQWSPNG